MILLKNVKTKICKINYKYIFIQQTVLSLVKLPFLRVREQQKVETGSKMAINRKYRSRNGV